MPKNVHNGQVGLHKGADGASKGLHGVKQTRRR